MRRERAWRYARSKDVLSYEVGKLLHIVGVYSQVCGMDSGSNIVVSIGMRPHESLVKVRGMVTDSYEQGNVWAQLVSVWTKRVVYARTTIHLGPALELLGS